MTICNLLIKQEILQKKREVPFGIQKEKRNNAAKILKNIHLPSYKPGEVTTLRILETMLLTVLPTALLTNAAFLVSILPFMLFWNFVFLAIFSLFLP
jgi:hypothetical protein